MMKSILTSIPALVAGFLIGCGSGDSGSGDSEGGASVTTSPAAGIWEGTGVTSKNDSGEIAGLIASNGKAMFVSDLPAVISGDVSVTGSTFRLNGTTFSDEAPAAITMSGIVTPGVSITANYSMPDENGTISLLKADASIGVYDRPSNLAKLQGVWNDSTSPSEGTWVFNIQGNGAFSAIRVLDNCTMNGTFTTIDSTKNEYATTATISSCDDFNGDYTGLAFTSDANSFTDNVVNIVITSSRHAGVFEATKQ